jgi:ribosomal protein L30
MVATITQIKSATGASPRQRAALRTLRLGRIGKSNEVELSAGLNGNIRQVIHLIEFAEDKEAIYKELGVGLS